MISPEKFTNKLVNLGVNFFSGVPDSLLKDFCAYIEDNVPPSKHIIASNEGCAIAIAAGTQIASGEIPLVYLQNSGLGNAINPLLSLLDKKVYSIPSILLIGWRGEPGVKDEPQHLKQGEVTIPMLKAMELPYFVLDKNEDESLFKLEKAINIAIKNSSPVILLAKKGIFESYITNRKTKKINYDGKLIGREQAIYSIVESAPKNTIFVSTTGYISRELYQIRKNTNTTHENDFLTVGSMGHSSQIALGISLINENNPIICLDGDGAMLMHMGGLTSFGIYGSRNLSHILLNNAMHDSVGGQPTVGFQISATNIAKSCSYKNIFGPISSKSEIEKFMDLMLGGNGPNFMEVRIKPGTRENLLRPKESPIFNKNLFINKIRKKGF